MARAVHSCHCSCWLPASLSCANHLLRLLPLCRRLLLMPPTHPAHSGVLAAGLLRVRDRTPCPQPVALNPKPYRPHGATAASIRRRSK
jgi:hypothetical protein